MHHQRSGGRRGREDAAGRRARTEMRLAGSYSNMRDMRCTPASSSVGNTCVPSMRLATRRPGAQLPGTAGFRRRKTEARCKKVPDKSAACAAPVASRVRPQRVRWGGRPARARFGRGARLRQVLRRPVGELVPVAQLGDAGPLVLAGCAQQLEDVQQLLQLAVAGEECDLRNRRPPSAGMHHRRL